LLQYKKSPADFWEAPARRPLPVEVVHGTADFRAEMERKLFTHNLGHAAFAYLGHLRGCTYVHESFADELSSRVFDGALDETSRALLARHDIALDVEEHEQIRRAVWSGTSGCAFHKACSRKTFVASAPPRSATMPRTTLMRSGSRP
jgi:hypothetical protein